MWKQNEKESPSWLKNYNWGDSLVKKKWEAGTLVRTDSATVEDYGSNPSAESPGADSAERQVSIDDPDNPSWASGDAKGDANGDANEQDDESAEGGEEYEDDLGAEGAQTETSPLLGAEDEVENDSPVWSGAKEQVMVPRTRRTACHLFFNFVTAVTALTLTCLLVTQLLPLFFVDGVPILQYALRCYVSIFCIIFMLVELDAPIKFLQKSQLMQNWISRGFIYEFVGLICAEESVAVRLEDDASWHHDILGHDFDGALWLSKFIEVSSWLMVGMGSVYLLMGICCLKRVRDRVMKGYKERLQRLKEEQEQKTTYLDAYVA